MVDELEKVKEKMKVLLNAGYEVYIIGGAVRDYLLGKKPKDIDLFTNANGKDIKKLFPKGVILGSKERQDKILTIIVDGIEISSYRSNMERTETGKSLKKHCSTCDLTINSIAMDINGEIIDYFNGSYHINKKIIKAVGKAEDRFDEDYLRILRAVRFALRFGFNIEAKTKQAIIDNRDKVLSLPKDRIRNELIKILSYPNALELLEETELDTILLNPIHKCHNINGGEHHKENVYEHLKIAYEKSLELTSDYRIWLACLLHDVGKPDAMEYKDDKITFHNHEMKSYDLALEWLNWLNFSNEDVNFISTLVMTHMQGYSDSMNKKSYIKFFNKLLKNKITIEDWHLLRFCDGFANLNNPRWKYCDTSRLIIKKYYEYKYSEEPFKISDLKIDGHDLMNRGYEGKAIGTKLNEIFELIMEAKLKNNRITLLEYLNNEM